MDYATAIPISVGVITGAGLLYKFFTPNKGGENITTRPKWMSEESKAEVGKLWDEKQSKEQCIEISTTIKKDIDEIKKSQALTQTGIQDIQKTLINWNKP